MGAGETSLPEFAKTLLRPAFEAMAQHAAAGAIAFVFCDWRSAPHFPTSDTVFARTPVRLSDIAR